MLNKYKYCSTCKNESDLSAESCEHCGLTEFEEIEIPEPDYKDPFWGHFGREYVKDLQND